MHVVHKSRVPIQVIGYGSSGTSIFCQLLREKLGVGIGTESQFVVRYYHALSEYGDLDDDRNLQRLIADLSRERWFERNEKFGFSCSEEQIFNDVKQRTYRGVLDAVFSQLANHLNAERWGDKTPDYVHDLPVLWELFPDAKYIHVVRDG
ncbi:MAG: sulfotransferase, partial [Planctomycetota bacterium]|nr:sulfotransferase [Planctomycetota bacterium]